MKMSQLREKDIARFWSKINVKSKDECWIFTAAKDKDKYGLICLYFDKKRTMFKSHRISYFLHYKIDPGKLYICHTCDNASCVNPSHLFAGTHKDNMQDKVNKGRSSKGSDHVNSKLTEEQVIAIRNDKRTIKEIIKDYNVSRSLIYFIKARKCWKHI